MNSPSGKQDNRIVGGMFGLAEPEPHLASRPTFLNGDATFFVSARSAMRFVIRQRNPRRVWMPSYLCETMLQALEGTGAELVFFPVDYNLQITDCKWLQRLGRHDIVVLISYFGFAIPGDLCRAIRERGALVLEDASQALLSNHVGRHADFVVYSPRKFIGVPDGGVLVNLSGQVMGGAERLLPPPGNWWLKAFAASLQRREFDRHGGDRKWFELFQDSEANCPVGDYASSELTRMLLLHAFDYADVAARRRKNYQFLLSGLKDVALFPQLPDDVVPIGFPVRVGNRDELRRWMFDLEIYLPIHWPMPYQVPAEFADCRRLANDILTLVCDQRCTQADLTKMCDGVTSHLKALE